MPYLRMFLGEQQLDEIFISDVFVDSVLGSHFVEEEKKILLDKYANLIKRTKMDPSFDLHPPYKKALDK